MIEEAPFAGAVDQRAEELQLRNAALQLGGAGLGARHRQRGKTLEAVGVLAAGGGQVIVHRPREINAGGAGHKVGARPGAGENLHGDARLVHVSQPRLADLRGKLERVRPADRRPAALEAAARDRRRIDCLDQGRDGEMFFERDDTHGRMPPVIRSGCCIRRGPQASGR